MKRFLSLTLSLVLAALCLPHPALSQLYYVKKDGLTYLTPEHPLLGAQLYGAHPGQFLMIAPDGSIVGTAAPAGGGPTGYFTGTPTVGVTGAPSGTNQALVASSPTGAAFRQLTQGDIAPDATLASATYLGANSAGRPIKVMGPASNTIYPGYNAYINFAQQASGSTGVDLSNSGNTCTLQSSSTWTTGGFTLGTAANNAGPVNSCVFPASTSLSDNTLINDRTLTFCGYKAPFSQAAAPTYAPVFGGNNASRIGALWLSGGIDNYFSPRASGFMAEYGTGTPLSNALTPVSGWHCLTWVLGSSTDNTKTRMYIDDTETSYGNQNGNLWDRRAVGDFYTLGTDYNTAAGGDWFPGIASAVLGYPGVLTPAQVANNWKALQYNAFYEYGVATPLSISASHANQLNCNGDSISAPGFQVYVATFCQLIGTSYFPLNTPFNVTSTGQAGNLLYNIISDEGLIDAPLASPYSEFLIASNEAGINDLNVGADQPGSVLQAKIAWARSIKGLGYQVVMPTLLSSSNQDGNVQAINAGLRAYALQNPGSFTLVDWANTPCLGASGAYNNPGGLGCLLQETGGQMTPTSCSITNNVATITGSNTFAVGDHIWPYINDGGLCGYFNLYNTSSAPFYHTITAASSTQISFPFSGSNLASTNIGGGQKVATLFQDGLHPTAFGQAVMTTEYQSVLNYLTGTTQQNPAVVTGNHTIAAGERWLSAQPAGTSTATITLPSCYGYSVTTPFNIWNQSASGNVAVIPPPGQTLAGYTSIPVAGIVHYISNISSSTASGCSWTGY